ncbi:MAG: hypothetical protein KAT09_02195, partial [Candidatus Aegiribacteria sp.]|nr:hypothetical protein [Candidatus Aegiribacteria sp.]
MQDHSIDAKIDLSRESASKIFGSGDSNLRYICKKLDVKAIYRDGSLYISGNSGRSVEKAKTVILRLEHELIASG